MCVGVCAYVCDLQKFLCIMLFMQRDRATIQMAKSPPRRFFKTLDQGDTAVGLQRRSCFAVHTLFAVHNSPHNKILFLRFAVHNSPHNKRLFVRYCCSSRAFKMLRNTAIPMRTSHRRHCYETHALQNMCIECLALVSAGMSAHVANCT